MGGMDYLFTPDFRSGLAIGYSGVTVDMREVPDTNRQDSFQASGYASYRPESKRWYIDCALSYSWNKYETQRHINVGSLYRVANASYNGAEISGYLEGGHRLSLKGFEVTPLVFVLAMKSSADGFTETDAGSANLTVDGNETESLQSGVGLKVSRQYEVRRDFFLTPEIGTRWFHEFGDTRAILNAHFADTPSGSYVVTSDTVDRDSAVISFNLQAKRDDRLRFFLGYDLGLRRDQTSHGVTGWVRYKW
jgi:outer membrane autotransporter protein